MKCTICNQRPARGGAYCANCASRMESQKRRGNGNKPVKFLTYHSHVVGLYPNGGKTLVAKLLKRSPEGLPKGKTLNLNTYLEGFTRDQIKAFKACILKLATA